MAYKGMFLKKTVPTDIREAVWWEEQCVRRQGGYDLDQSNLPASLKWLPKGTLLKLTNTGGCIAVKTAKVVEKAAKAATTLKIASGSLVKVGDTLGGAKINAISSASGVDTLTVETLGDAIEADAIISDYDKTKDVILGFSYDTIEIYRDAQNSATPTLKVMEVDESTLPYPVNDELKEAINKNGIALFKIK